MSLSKTEMDKVVEDHFRYEATDDVEGVLATLSEDAEHDIVGWPKGPQHGRDKAREFYESMFADIRGEKTTCLNRYYGDDFMVDETLWEGRADGSPFGFEGKGRPIKFRILHVFEFDQDGRIKRENAWIDMAALQEQLG